MADSTEPQPTSQVPRRLLQEVYPQEGKLTQGQRRILEDLYPQEGKARTLPLSVRQLRALKDMYSQAKKFLKSAPPLQGDDEHWSNLMARGLVARVVGGGIKYLRNTKTILV